jgi:hypothetical protein
MFFKLESGEQIIYKDIRPFTFLLLGLCGIILTIIYFPKYGLTKDFFIIITSYGFFAFIFNGVVLTNKKIIARIFLIVNINIYYDSIIQYICYFPDDLFENPIYFPFCLTVITAEKSYNMRIYSFQKIDEKLYEQVIASRYIESDQGISDKPVKRKPRYIRWPGNIESLIQAGNETLTVFFKSTWNPETKNLMIQTICALANDVDFGGGYIIIGIDEEIDEGAPFLPPTGLRIIAELNKSDLENIQK